ncbi:hypothetical protein ACIGW7_40150 [Streptomyces sp. NPDC053253]|uniref:hypothetical protein n=1 Tax=Streptomyces sp. NPDC053253 TaxID=3365699 RepID=UPI0037D551DD
MKRRLAALLLALVAVFGVSVVAAPQPARADGPISNGIEGACRVASGPVLGTILGIKGKVSGIGGITGSPLCDKLGDAAEAKIKEEWKNVWDSVLGDVIKSAADGAKWVIKKVLTVALLGPSVDLEATGLWGTKDEDKDGQPDVTLSGMLMWLGLVIAAGGFMWQVGKMAVTGQTKHLGRAMAGWVENIILSAIGVSLFALLLVAADALSAGLVNATFANDGKAYERILAVMMPNGISNPILMLGVVQVLLIVGFIQLIMVFLRQSAIPIICLLLPVAGGGRAGGDATRQWAPKLITAGLVVVTYKPILAIIICTGFAEFGHAQTLAEWLRGCATLILGVLAPGPLTRIFAPFGEAVGSGMSSGGASGAFGAAAGYLGGKLGGGDSDSGGGGGGDVNAVQHAQFVENSMGKQGEGQGQGPEGGQGSDVQAQAARNEATATIPAQAGPEGVVGQTGTATASTGAATTVAAGTATAGVGLAVEVMDGINDGIQGAAGQIGGGGNQQ